MLDASNILQIAQGSTGSSTVASYEMAFLNPTTDGSSVIIAVAAPGQSGGPLFLPTASPVDFVGSGPGSLNGTGIFPACTIMCRQTSPGGGETTIGTVNNIGANDGGLYVALEVSGLASSNYDPFTFGCMSWDQWASQVGFDQDSATLSIDESGIESASGDEIVIALGAIYAPTGTPVSFVSVADVTPGLPGTWTRAGVSAATGRGGGLPNVRLDVFYRFSSGQTALYDALITYASSPGVNAAALGLLSAYMAFSVNPEQTRTRAAAGSIY